MPSAAAMACEVDLGDAMDHISDLSDDLLLHVLRFLPDARDVVCASLLSTRWRRLLTRARALHRELELLWPPLHGRLAVQRLPA
jgi:hypothetical protein